MVLEYVDDCVLFLSQKVGLTCESEEFSCQPGRAFGQVK